MVTATPVKPIVLANFYLDNGTLHYSGAGITFKGTPYTSRIITAGNIERSIPLPSGQLQIPDAQITIADVDGTIRALIDDVTPIRRLVEIIPELASHKDDATPNNPLFIGEILDYTCPPGEITINLKSITAAWLSRPILHLINRDNFPNIPDDVTTGFAPIIFGRVRSIGSLYGPHDGGVSNIENQGAIQCIHVDTVNHDYVVARHPCYDIPHVFRKRPLDSRFTLVSASEYTTPIVNYTLGGVTYSFQMIRFAAQQYDGTIIQCDVSGSYSKYDWEGNTQVDSVEVRNPSDCLWNLIYIQLQNEVNIDRFDADSFIEVRNRCSDRSYFCDGAITGKTNSLEVITCGAAISKLCDSSGIDFIQTTAAEIQIKLFDLTIDAPLAVPVDADITLERTFTPSAPAEIINHFRYRYFRDNAGLPDGIRAKGNREYAFEYNIRNATDQTELAATGANPKLDKTIELAFVRDDAMAVDVIKKRVPYHALRSYDVAFSIPAWSGGSFTGINIDLGQACNLTSIWGIGATGFVDALSRIKVVTVDLKEWEIRYKAVVYWPTTDGDLDIEFTGHPVHATQTRKPQFPVTVNGTTVVTAPKNIDLGSLPAAPFGFSNIIFQEDASVEPRRVSAYYSASGGTGVVIYYGTLDDPDERPGGLGLGDAAKVLFYSTDFDHMYIWNGVAWTCIDYTAGAVSWFIQAPTSNGWVLCDGSGTTSITSNHGDITTISIPNLTGSSYVRGGTSYSGPSPTTAIAPTLSGLTTQEDANHSHQITPSGSVTGNLPSHTHDATNTYTGPPKTSGGGAAWGTTDHFTAESSSTLSGSTGDADLSHAHSFGVFGGATDTSFSGVAVQEPVEGTVEAAAPFHNHGFSFSGTTDEAFLNHSHDAGSIGVTTSVTVATNTEHYHIVDFPTGDVSGSPPALTLVFTGDNNTTGTQSVAHHHGPGTLAISTTGEPKHMTLLPYLRL